MIAIIQAGGAGTRLKSISKDLPKPLVEIAGKPILLWQIENLVSCGITEVVIVISKTGEAIPNYFGDGSKFGASITYIREEQPLGSAGALYFAKDKIDQDFILLWGDLMLDIDWNRFIAFHQEKGSLLTAFAHPNSHPFDSDLLKVDSDSKITAIDSKRNVRNYYYENLTNAGLYIVSKKALEGITEPRKIDFEKEIFLPLIQSQNTFAYKSSEYVKDCGTPDRFAAVLEDIKANIVASKNLKLPQKAIFLDRDGTINVFGDFVVKASMLHLKDDAIESISRINHSEYLAICVTNQPVIARGDTTFEEMDNIHNKMEDELGEKGAYLNDLFFCPHHPDFGYPGEVRELKIKCNCRKPNIGMLLKAKEKYNIDLTKSWMIGDTLQDMQTGINAGCKTILLTSGDPHYAKKYPDAKPDYIVSQLKDALDIIFKE